MDQNPSVDCAQTDAFGLIRQTAAEKVQDAEDAVTEAKADPTLLKQAEAQAAADQATKQMEAARSEAAVSLEAAQRQSAETFAQDLAAQKAAQDALDEAKADKAAADQAVTEAAETLTQKQDELKKAEQAAAAVTPEQVETADNIGDLSKAADVAKTDAENAVIAETQAQKTADDAQAALVAAQNTQNEKQAAAVTAANDANTAAAALAKAEQDLQAYQNGDTEELKQNADQAVADAQAVLEEKQAAQATADQALAEAKTVTQAAQTAADDAAAALKTAQDASATANATVNEKTTALEDATTEKTAADNALLDATNKTAAAEAEVAQKKQAVADAEAALKEAQQAQATSGQNVKDAEAEVAQAQAAVNQDEADRAALKAKGSLGFFETQADEDPGAAEAVKVINGTSELADTSNSTDTWENFKAATHVGEEGDATSFANTLESLKILDEVNAARTKGDNNFASMNPLKVSNLGMAISQVHTNWSAYHIAHAKRYGGFENLSWTQNTDHAVSLWMEEKAAYDEAKATGKPAKSETGHYETVMNNGLVSGGAGINTRRAGQNLLYGNTYGLAIPSFYYTNIEIVYTPVKGEKTFTVDEYRALLNQYIKDLDTPDPELTQALTNAQNNLKAAQEEDHIQAVATAQTNLDTAKNAKTAADTALTQAQAAQTEAQEKADQAATKATQASSNLETAKTAAATAKTKVTTAQGTADEKAADLKAKQSTQAGLQAQADNAAAAVAAAAKTVEDKQDYRESLDAVTEKTLRAAIDTATTANNAAQKVKTDADQTLAAAKAATTAAQTAKDTADKALDAATQAKQEAQDASAAADKARDEAQAIVDTLGAVAPATQAVTDAEKAGKDAAAAVVAAEKAVTDAQTALDQATTKAAASKAEADAWAAVVFEDAWTEGLSEPKDSTLFDALAATFAQKRDTIQSAAEAQAALETATKAAAEAQKILDAALQNLADAKKVQASIEQQIQACQPAEEPDSDWDNKYIPGFDNTRPAKQTPPGKTGCVAPTTGNTVAGQNWPHAAAEPGCLDKPANVDAKQADADTTAPVSGVKQRNAQQPTTARVQQQSQNSGLAVTGLDGTTWALAGLLALTGAGVAALGRTRKQD